EVGPGMLAGLKAVPIPGGSAIIVAGNLPQVERGSVGPLRRQRKQGRLRAERLGQVNHAQGPAVQLRNQVLENVRHNSLYPPLRRSSAAQTVFVSGYRRHEECRNWGSVIRP